MIVLDANLLLYAKVAEYPQPSRAHAWLEARLNGVERVGLPWPYGELPRQCGAGLLRVAGLHAAGETVGGFTLPLC